MRRFLRSCSIPAVCVAAMYLLILFGCDLTRLPSEESYVYTAFDEEGNVLSAGRLYMEYSAGVGQNYIKIRGTWGLTRITEAPNIGPQSGKGQLDGLVNEDGEIRMDFNPDGEDNSFSLTGSFSERQFGDFEGTWHYLYAGGVRQTGRFEAERW